MNDLEEWLNKINNYSLDSTAFSRGFGNQNNPYYSQINSWDNDASNVNISPNNGDQSFVDALLTGLKDSFLQNPIGNTIGIGQGLWGLYDGFNRLKMQKQALNMAKDNYAFQKQMMLNNEKRNQEQWDMLKRQRASSSL